MRRLPAGPCRVVEVGVWRPFVCATLLALHPSVQVTLVDPWRTGVPGCGRLSAWPQAAYDAAFCAARALRSAYPDRCSVWRASSETARRFVDDRSVALVFLDGDHAPAAVERDIGLWAPTIQIGGWVGGHDYGHPDHPGVRAAVDAVYALVEEDEDYTWWVPAW